MSLSLPFLSAWKQFYEKAHPVVTSPDEDATKIESTLVSLTKLLSTLDAPKKQIAVAHGALELAVQATQRLLHTRSNTAVVIGLKACQSCVLKNPGARASCRSEGVFELLSSILEYTSLMTNDADRLLLESETFTTLAAVCLGNDLNALFATIIYGEMVESKVSVASRTNMSTPCSRLHQTLVYLQALFQVTRTEQKQLLESRNHATVLNNIKGAEECLRRGIQQEQNHQWSQCETTCTRALVFIECLTPHTTVLDDLHIRLVDCRSAARLGLQDWDGVLKDVQLCLSKVEESSSICRPVVARLHTRRADALKELKRWQEARDALDLALRLSPEAREKSLLIKKMNRLQLAKNKNSQGICHHKQQKRRRSMDNSKRRHELNVVELDSWLARAGKHQPVYSPARLQEKGGNCTADTAAKQPPIVTNTTKPGTCVKSLFGIGTVQEVRKCGTTKIQLESWSPGGQPSTAYLMPEFYTVVTKPGSCVKSLFGIGTVQEVRKCGTTKIQLESWSPGGQPSTAYLMPEFYTVVSE